MPPETKGPADGYFLHKTVMIPADHKKIRMGEDAAEGSERFLVVSDGAGHGEWARKGIDSGFFSRHLAKGMHDHYARSPGADPYYLLFE